MVHESLHGYEQNAGFKDAVHTMDEQGRLKEMLAKHLERNELEKKVGLLQYILELTKIVISLKKKPRVVTDLLPLVKRQSDKVIAAMSLLGLPVRVVEGYRSPERQTELYNQGRTTKGNIVTNAKAGESLHNFGCAVDLVFRKQGYNATNKQWKLLGDIGKVNGFEWGGDFKNFIDRPHLEMKLGYSLKDFQSGKIDYTKFN
jgi:peptidoglycan L-alanyl-D-glutamate endopeptidase CwlK